MNSGLDQACAILDEFEKEITGVQAIWKELANLNPDFEHIFPQKMQMHFGRIIRNIPLESFDCVLMLFQ